MDYRIAICDDSRKDRQYVLELLGEWLEHTSHTAEVSQFDSAESFMLGGKSMGDYDMLLLDIEMQAMDGVELARRIRRESDIVQIIFISGYSDYISEGYEVAALHYLLKPIKKEKLFTVLDRAAERLIKDEKMLLLESGGEAHRVSIRRIKYAEVFGNYVTVHANRKYTVRMTLGEFEKLLDDRFFRVGRSTIVNLNEIGRVTKQSIVLLDGSLISLPRGAYESINRAIIERT